jgi:hypothetical protein
MTPFFEAVNSNNATAATAALDVDYMRSWQDDNVDASNLPQGAGNPSDTSNVDTNVQTPAPLIADSAPADDPNSLIKLSAATSEDTVFNKDVYVKGTLFANKIRANQIDGLELFTDKIGSLQQKLANALNPTASAQSATVQTTPLPLNLNINGALSVGGPAEFHGNVAFYKLVTFVEKSIFNNDVTFAAHIVTSGDAPDINVEDGAGITSPPVDNPNANLAKSKLEGNDNSGQLTISTGENSKAGDLVSIKFNKSYSKAPQIFLTPANSASTTTKYYVVRANDGFKIVVTEPIPPGTEIQLYYWVVQ